MKPILFVVGLVAIVAGLVWAAQGAGIFPYPAESFMINEKRWVYIGLITALIGVIVTAASLRW